MNFAEVIPDFDGSEDATDRVIESEAYQNSRFAFITPDNCLAHLRRRMIEDSKPFVMSTYGIYRGSLDYGMIWTIAAVSVLLSVLFYQAVVIVERRVLRRLGMATAE